MDTHKTIRKNGKTVLVFAACKLFCLEIMTFNDFSNSYFFQFIHKNIFYFSIKYFFHYFMNIIFFMFSSKNNFHYKIHSGCTLWNERKQFLTLSRKFNTFFYKRKMKTESHVHYDNIFSKICNLMFKRLASMSTRTWVLEWLGHLIFIYLHVHILYKCIG